MLPLECRICHSASAPSALPPISPCECRGTLSYVHAACLEEWIVRRLNQGVSLTTATTCELCHSRIAHLVYPPKWWEFFCAQGAWRRWAHMGYALLIARRLLDEVRLVARDNKKRGGDMVVGMVGVAHYVLFLAIDARLLWTCFWKWRGGVLKVQVVQKNQDIDE